VVAAFPPSVMPRPVLVPHQHLRHIPPVSAVSVLRVLAAITAKRQTVTRIQTAATDLHRLDPEAATVVLPVERVAVQEVLAIPLAQMAASVRQARHRVAVVAADTRLAHLTTVVVVVLVQQVGSCSRIRQPAATGDGEYF